MAVFAKDVSVFNDVVMPGHSSRNVRWLQMNEKFKCAGVTTYKMPVCMNKSSALMSPQCPLDQKDRVVRLTLP